MRALHFSVAYRTRGTKQAPAQAHVRYITRAQAGAAEHIGYVTRTTQQTREDLVATGYGNLPPWAHDDPAAFFAESDRWERMNGRTATQITAMLPRALGRDALVASVETFVRSQLGTSHAYVWGIHETQASDGGRYPHVHIAFSERRDTGLAQTPQAYFAPQVNPKERSFSHRQWPYAARQAWSDTLNVALEAAGASERVSARSFRDQGIDWQTADYIDRKTLQRDKSLLHQRTQTADTPEALAKRTQEWETRKRELGIARDMAMEVVVQRIGEASRARLQMPGDAPQRTRAVDIDAAHAQAKTHTPTRAPSTREDEPVLGNKRSRIYHHPSHPHYRDIHPANKVRFLNAGAAEAAGYRRAYYKHMEEGEALAQRLAYVRALRQAEEHYMKNHSQIRTPSHLAAIAKVLHDDEQEHGRVRRRGRQRDDEQERTRTHGREW